MAVVQLKLHDKIIRFFKRDLDAKYLNELLPKDFRRRLQKAESGLSVYVYDNCDLTRWYQTAPETLLYGVAVANIADLNKSVVIDLNGLTFTRNPGDTLGHYNMHCSNCNLDELKTCQPKQDTCPFILNPPPVDTNKIIRQAFMVKFPAARKEQLKSFVEQQSGKSVANLTEEPSAID